MSSPFQYLSSRLETVLNSVLVAAFVGSALWAAAAPSVAPILNRI